MNISNILLNAVNNNYNIYSSLLMFISISLVFYFFMIKPQTKKINDHKLFLKNLKKGEKIITSGGIIGHIESIHDNFIIINVSNNIKIKFQKNYIASYISESNELVN